MTIQSNVAMSHAKDISRRQASIVAGLGLLLMAILAPIANFGAVLNLMVPSDPAATSANILSSVGLFRAGIGILVIVAILDIIVAWALYYLFAAAHRSLSLLAAWLRLVYAAVFAVAANHLLQVLSLLDGKAFTTALSEAQLQVQVMQQLDAFLSGWDLGLLIFGTHLLILGYLVLRDRDFPRFLGILIMIAGIGYMVDSLGKILAPGYGLTISMYTFIGEVLLIFWLLWRGIKGFKHG